MLPFYWHEITSGLLDHEQNLFAVLPGRELGHVWTNMDKSTSASLYLWTFRSPLASVFEHHAFSIIMT